LTHGVQNARKEGDVLGGADALKIIRFVAFADGSPSEGKGDLLAWALTAALVIAGSSYWVGMQSVKGRPAKDQSVTAVGPASTQVSQSSGAQPPNSGTFLTIRSAPVRKSAVDTSSARTPAREPMNVPAPDERKSAEAAKPGEVAGQVRQKSSEVAPSSSRTPSAQAIRGTPQQQVRIGRFATPSDAEKGWAAVVHQWPGMERLRVVPVPIKSLRDGRGYYRLEVGTTSRAHSEVVCQRVHDMDQSCTIIGADEGSVESAF
jgi:hypothetical protein